MAVCRYRLGSALPLVLVFGGMSSAPVLLGQSAQAPPAPTKTAPREQAPTKTAPKPKAPQTSRTDAALPTARAIIDRHIVAVGGRAAILARTSTHASGTVSIPSAGMTGSVDVFAAKPDKTLLRVTLGGIGSLEDGFDGKIGWSLSPVTGPSLAQGKELEQKRFNSDFLADLHADTRYESMTTMEKTDFEGRPCYKLRLVRRGGAEEFEFYDVETGLKAGGITTVESPMGPITGTTIEGDYKKFGPLLQPTTLKQTLMGLQQVFTFTSIEFDKVDPATFEAPAPIKALLK
jgi:hypothetical protein